MIILALLKKMCAKKMKSERLIREKPCESASLGQTQNGFCFIVSFLLSSSVSCSCGWSPSQKTSSPVDIFFLIPFIRKFLNGPV